MQVVGRRIQVNELVVSADLDMESVLLNTATGMYYGLDPVATAIWKLLEQGRAEGEIVTALLAEFEVDHAQLEADVAEFLELLFARGLAQLRH